MRERILGIMAIIGLLGAFFGSYAYMEDRYAHSDTVAQMQQKYDYKFKIIEIKGITERIWQLEDRIKRNPNDETAKEELRKLREEKIILERDLKERR